MVISANPFLLKSLALALAASQIFVGNHVKMSFNAEKDEAEILATLHGGCDYMRGELAQQFPDLAGLDLGEWLSDRAANAEQNQLSTEIFDGVSVNDAKEVYDMFCKGTSDSLKSNELLKEVVSYYNATLHSLKDYPGVETVRNYHLPVGSSVYDAKGDFLLAAGHGLRREEVSFAELPPMMGNAFVAAEDNQFWKHNGLDTHGFLRAAMGKMMAGEDDDASKSGAKKRIKGGSTIPQQIIKNLSVGDAYTPERKLREMVLANKLVNTMSKQDILALYANSIFFGRAWGIKAEAKACYGKELKDLRPVEMASLAGLPKNPTGFSPDLHPDKFVERTKIVLTQMLNQQFLSQTQYDQALEDLKTLTCMPKADEERPKSAGFFTDELGPAVERELGLNIFRDGLRVQSTLHGHFQEKVEAMVQERLAQWEGGRAVFKGPLANLSAVVSAQGWPAALQGFTNPYADVHWQMAIVTDVPIIEKTKKGVVVRSSYKVGLADGKTQLPLRSWVSGMLKQLTPNDVIYVHVESGVAWLRVPPIVQTAVMVVENKTGKVVTMMGGFSHAMNQFNRATTAQRQPGSTAKPFTYMAALQNRIQPNTLISTDNIHFTEPDYSPANFEEGGNSSAITVRTGLEESNNVVTARLMTFLDNDQDKALKTVTDLMQSCGLRFRQEDMPIHVSMVLGGMDIYMTDLVACYAGIANGGLRHKLHYIEKAEKDGKSLEIAADKGIPLPVDQVTLFQLRTMMQGVLERGTATSVRALLEPAFRAHGYKGSPSVYIAAKTGTTNRSENAWLVGSTNDLTIAVWVGYDKTSDTKGGGSLGGKEATGALVAGPLWAKVLEASLDDYPLKPLPPPSAEVDRQIYSTNVDRAGNILNTNDGQGVMEYLRHDEAGHMYDTHNLFYTPPPPAPDPDPPQADPNDT